MNKFSRGTFTNRFLALGGILVVLAQTIYAGSRAATNTVAPTALQLQIWFGVVLLGVVLNQIGVWGLASRVFGGRRRYHQLRAEVSFFLSKVSELNTARVEERAADVQKLTQEMQASVERMQTVAGVEGTPEPLAEPARSGT